ncbi:MAG: efflux RND transporter periplasmic adaptor subunit, partial [Actinobacteria bacterium]|nr:efflux RND transporter periplasmic adaptor subunit [Actinomycetota bacterium]NIS30347.1 efflux RND transporter periplasmic adaptor subunit [Actinomycetota bacterium]NIT97713.1 efflux RND transporter periplasmic adaptor subunit [Actinomycetota bacterium]NIU18679.1 efflux RND transporter periplasmic adaptor subunit [Actinomycetota bacterium]NIU65572.1 efflux RND transporter periplasmic adaptor subunit [Actinomycetota bacterium]
AISQDATGNDIVRVVDPDTRVASDTPIVTGLQEGSFTEVVSGLSGGEVIIIDVRN